MHECAWGSDEADGEDVVVIFESFSDIMELFACANAIWLRPCVVAKAANDIDPITPTICFFDV
jgi:hypothetical protein